MQTEVLLRVNGRYRTATWYKDIDKLSCADVMDHDVLIDFSYNYHEEILQSHRRTCLGHRCISDYSLRPDTINVQKLGMQGILYHIHCAKKRVSRASV